MRNSLVYYDLDVRVSEQWTLLPKGAIADKPFHRPIHNEILGLRLNLTSMIIFCAHQHRVNENDQIILDEAHHTATYQHESKTSSFSKLCTWQAQVRFNK